MGVTIGNNNVFKGSINIGDNALQIAKNFNQEFNTVDKLLDLLKNDLENNYIGDDKSDILEKYESFKEELRKPSEKQDRTLLKKLINKINPAFDAIANTSSIASLYFSIITLMQ